MVRLYKERSFVIYGTEDQYIVTNLKKEFSEYHTHIRDFRTAQFIIKLLIHKSVPHHKNPYYLKSLILLTTDESYRNRLLELLNNKKRIRNNSVKKKGGNKNGKD